MLDDGVVAMMMTVLLLRLVMRTLLLLLLFMLRLMLLLMLIVYSIRATLPMNRYLSAMPSQGELCCGECDWQAREGLLVGALLRLRGEGRVRPACLAASSLSRSAARGCRRLSLSTTRPFRVRERRLWRPCRETSTLKAMTYCSTR